MPLSPIPVSPFPDVPALPGVPPVNRSPGLFTQITSAIDATLLVVADSAIVASLLAKQNFVEWGIFDSNNRPVITASVVKLEYKKEKRISTAPQENGAFLSYNKVSEPISGRLTFAKGATLTDRHFYLQSIDDGVDSLALYTVIMPDNAYENVNLTHVDFKRDSKSGVQLISCEVWFEEVRIVQTAEFTNTATPAGQDPSNGGDKQPQTPKRSQVRTANPKVGPSRSDPFGATSSDASNPITYNSAGGPSPSGAAPTQAETFGPPAVSPAGIPLSGPSADSLLLVPGM